MHSLVGSRACVAAWLISFVVLLGLFCGVEMLDVLAPNTKQPLYIMEQVCNGNASAQQPTACGWGDARYASCLVSVCDCATAGNRPTGWVRDVAVTRLNNCGMPSFVPLWLCVALWSMLGIRWVNKAPPSREADDRICPNDGVAHTILLCNALAALFWTLHTAIPDAAGYYEVYATFVWLTWMANSEATLRIAIAYNTMLINGGISGSESDGDASTLFSKRLKAWMLLLIAFYSVLWWVGVLYRSEPISNIMLLAGFGLHCLSDGILWVSGPMLSLLKSLGSQGPRQAAVQFTTRMNWWRSWLVVVCAGLSIWFYVDRVPGMWMLAVLDMFSMSWNHVASRALLYIPSRLIAALPAAAPPGTSTTMPVPPALAPAAVVAPAANVVTPVNGVPRLRSVPAAVAPPAAPAVAPRYVFAPPEPYVPGTLDLLLVDSPLVAPPPLGHNNATPLRARARPPSREHTPPTAAGSLTGPVAGGSAHELRTGEEDVGLQWGTRPRGGAVDEVDAFL